METISLIIAGTIAVFILMWVWSSIRIKIFRAIYICTIFLILLVSFSWLQFNTSIVNDEGTSSTLETETDGTNVKEQGLKQDKSQAEIVTEQSTEASKQGVSEQTEKVESSTEQQVSQESQSEISEFRKAQLESQSEMFKQSTESTLTPDGSELQGVPYNYRTEVARQQQAVSNGVSSSVESVQSDGARIISSINTGGTIITTIEMQQSDGSVTKIHIIKYSDGQVITMGDMF
ncbi:hypothetical protein AALA56_02605 [Streptococcus hyointestinalis]|uniref:hypothetical protein n=1 Tax=Streptococcus hyointestinalis TaxID=1337 RepID=UPI003518155C